MTTEYANTSDEPAQIVNKIKSLSWVNRITPTNRDDATHCLSVSLSVIRLPYEGQTLANIGAPVVAVSAIPDKGARVYVDMRGYDPQSNASSDD